MMDTHNLTPETGVVLRCARWDPPAGTWRGDAVLLTGRSEFVEKYGETAERLNDRGWRVWSLDWRGQGRSTRPLANPQKGHIDDFATYVRDLRAFVAWIREHGAIPSLVMAHSMGGHIALRYLMDTSDHAFTRAVLIAPMIAPKFTPLQRAAAQVLAPSAVRLGLGDRYALGQGDAADTPPPFEGNPLTGDRRRFDETQALVAADPALQLGGVTWGWIAATLRSSAHIGRAARFGGVPIPGLVVFAGDERIVDNDRAAAVFASVSSVETITLPAARHEILRETDAVLDQVWAAFDRFVVRT